TRWVSDWSSDVCSSDLVGQAAAEMAAGAAHRVFVQGIHHFCLETAPFGSEVLDGVVAAVVVREGAGQAADDVGVCQADHVERVEIGRASCREREERCGG